MCNDCEWIMCSCVDLWMSPCHTLHTSDENKMLISCWHGILLTSLTGSHDLQLSCLIWLFFELLHTCQLCLMGLFDPYNVPTGMYLQVREYVLGCEECKHRKTESQEVSDQRWWLLTSLIPHRHKCWNAVLLIFYSLWNENMPALSCTLDRHLSRFLPPILSLYLHISSYCSYSLIPLSVLLMICLFTLLPLG